MRFPARFGLVGAALIAVSTAPTPTPALADQIRNDQWHLKYLDIAKAHSISQGKGITVAVVDSGVEPHPDLRGNLLPGRTVVPGKSGDGRQDDDGHGTAMAGVIAGHGRGSDGILGIAPESKILPVREWTSKAVGDSGTVAAGITWAAQNGAKVINVSSASAPTDAMNRAIENAKDSDAVVVAGTGNRPKNFRVGYPAAIPGVLAVGAVDRSGKLANLSVTGNEVQLCAPGIEIESTGLRGEYRIGTGTSDSAAIVSGAAALVRAKFPDLAAEQVIARLTSTATDIGPPGRDDECGFGVINIVKALTATGQQTSPSASPAAAASATTPNTAIPTTAPADEPNTLALVGGTLGVVAVLAGAVLGFLAIRRRRT